MVDGFDHLGIFITFVSKPLAHVCPVLLFHMGVIVLFVGAVEAQVHRYRTVEKVVPKVEGEEFRAVVHIEATQGERQCFLHFLAPVDYFLRAFVPDCAVLGPLAVNVCKCGAPDKITSQRVATMSNGIGFQVTRLVNVIIACSDGNQMPESGSSRTRSTKPLACKRVFFRSRSMVARLMARRYFCFDVSPIKSNFSSLSIIMSGPPLPLFPFRLGLI